MTDIQSITNDPIHIDRYIREYLALDTRYADEVTYGKSNSFGGSDYTTYTWYIDKRIRDVVQIELYNFTMLYPINNNRRRVSVEIVEFNSETFIHPNGNRFHFIGDLMTNYTIAYPGQPVSPEKYVSINNNFNFKTAHTLTDKISVNFYDGVDRMDVPYTLDYYNVVINFGGIVPTFIFPIEFENIIKHYGSRVSIIISDFTTSDPITDAALIEYINRSEGFPEAVLNKQLSIYYVLWQYQYPSNILPLPAGPVGIPSTCTVKIIYPNRVQLDLAVIFKEPRKFETNYSKKRNSNLFINKNKKEFITSIKQLPIMDIQRMISYPYKHVYVSLDTKNAADILNKKIYSWYIEDGLRNNLGCASVIGNLENIVAVRLCPIFMNFILVSQFTYPGKGVYDNANYSENPEMFTFYIRELPNSYVGKLENKYHFKLEKKYNLNKCKHYDLTPTQDYYWLRDCHTQLTSITLELNQIQNLPLPLNIPNIQVIDLLTTMVSIIILYTDFGTGRVWLIIVDPNSLQIGDIIIISGYDTGSTQEENDLVNNPLGYKILSIVGNTFELDFIPGFMPFQYGLTGTIPASKTIINLEFLTL